MFNKQKQYFKKKIEGVQKMIWDMEFKRAKTLSIREGIRVEYDNAKSKATNLEETIKTQKENPTMEAGDIARLDDSKTLLDKDIEQFLNQLKQLDLEVHGSKPTAELHEGYTGIDQQLDALRELKEMLIEYIKEL